MGQGSLSRITLAIQSMLVTWQNDMRTYAPSSPKIIFWMFCPDYGNGRNDVLILSKTGASG